MNRISFSLVLCVGLLCACGPSPKEISQQAEAAMDQKQWQDAAKLIDTLPHESPEHTKGRERLARELSHQAEESMSKNQWQAAIDLYQQIPQESGEYTQAQNRIPVAKENLDGEKLAESICGDWEGQAVQIIAGVDSNPEKVKFRIKTGGVMQVVYFNDFAGNWFGARNVKYEFSPKAVHVHKVVKDDFGTVKGSKDIKAYPFRFEFDVPGYSNSFRFLVFESDNAIKLYTNDHVIKDELSLSEVMIKLSR